MNRTLVLEPSDHRLTIAPHPIQQSRNIVIVAIRYTVILSQLRILYITLLLEPEKPCWAYPKARALRHAGLGAGLGPGALPGPVFVGIG